MSNNTNTPEVNIPENSSGTEITSPFPKIIGLDVLEHFTVKIKDYISSLLGNKQDKLTDNSLKKINNESLIGEGNISIVSSPIELVDTDFESIDDINSSGISNINLSTQAQILPYKFMNNSVYEQLIPFEEIVNCNIEIENPLFITADLIATNKCKPVSIKNYLNNIIELENEITDIWDYLKIVYTGKKIDYSKEYFTIKSLEDGLTVKLSRNASEYRIDNGEWVSLNAGATTPSINNGQTIQFRITNPTISSSYGIGIFTINKKCNVSGNIMSLLYGDNFEGQIDLSGKNKAFYQLFKNCTTLQNAENLILPAMELASDCYSSMFSNCTSLETAPQLPATKLASSCYSMMFNGTNVLPDCSNIDFANESVVASGGLKGLFRGTKITDADLERILPKNDEGKYCLPSTTLAENCYSYMFSNCTNLTEAPELPATTLVKNCYASMFYGCTSLTTAPALPATTLASRCYDSMFSNCTSLITALELPATTLAEACYQGMFLGCTSLETAPSILPATTLAEACYQGMFNGCTSLTTAPELPSTTLATSCYSNMFWGCTSLETAPSILPATTLAEACYQGMFNGCTSLTTAPELPATILATSCYNSMFYGCTNLNYIKMLATNIRADYCLNGWVYRVASSGTFVKSAVMTSLPSGNNGIPEGWTVTDYTE